MSAIDPLATAAPLELGWFTLCLKGKQFTEMVQFYKALGFRSVGGNEAYGYAVLANGSTTLTPMSFLQSNLINFRGGDTPALAAQLAARGFEIFHMAGMDPTAPDAKQPGPRAYDTAAWPDEYNNDKDGNPLPHDGSGDFMIQDPDGNLILFDTVPVERARHIAGERFSTEEMDGSLAEGQPELGQFTLHFKVADLAKSREFYSRLGMSVKHDMPEYGFCMLESRGDSYWTIGLKQMPTESDLLYFECPNVAAVIEAASANGLTIVQAPDFHDGSKVARVQDPEGNMLFFRQKPG